MVQYKFYIVQFLNNVVICLIEIFIFYSSEQNLIPAFGQTEQLYMTWPCGRFHINLKKEW